MFKKKTNLPPRPKYPSSDQIIDDLSSVTNDDPLFKAGKAISERRLKNDGAHEQDAVYEKIKKFFNMHDSLLETMKKLDELQKNISEKETEIVKMSDNLKEQAKKAVDKGIISTT